MTCLPEADAELPDSWTLWLDLWAQSVRHPEVARVREEFDAHWRETIAGVVRDGQASGEFGDVDATEFAITLSALLDGFAIQIALEDPIVDPRTGLHRQHAIRRPGARFHLEGQEQDTQQGT